LSSKVFLKNDLTIFPQEYFHVVFIQGDVKLSAYFFDWRMLWTWNLAQILTTLCSFKKCKKNHYPCIFLLTSSFSKKFFLMS